MRATTKRVIVALSCALAVVVGLSACGQREVGETDHRLTASLEHNAGTSYSWYVNVSSDGGKLPLDVESEQDVDVSSGGVVGGPMVDTWVFVPSHIGSCTLTFTLTDSSLLGIDASAEQLADLANAELAPDAIQITVRASVAEDGTITIDGCEPSEYASWFAAS